MKTAIFFPLAALCSIAVAIDPHPLPRLVERQSADECLDTVDREKAVAQNVPVSTCTPFNSSVQYCNTCGALCLYLTGETKSNCSQLYYEDCNDAGVPVFECSTLPQNVDVLPGVTDRPDCLAAFNFSSTALKNLPDQCIVGRITDAAQVCRDCIGSVCLSYSGEAAEDCMQFFYDTCKAEGVEISECGALALVMPVKGVVAVVILIAAFLVF